MINQEYQDIINEFSSVLEKTLPNFYHSVVVALNLGTPFLRIVIACNDHKINNISFQYPQVVSLYYDLLTEELTVQSFGGCGGNRILIKPQNPHKYCDSITVPFRVSKTLNASLRNLSRFCERYKKLLKENEVNLIYQDIVNYADILT